MYVTVGNYHRFFSFFSVPGQPRWFGGHGSVCVGGGRPWPPHPLQESARHRPRLRLPSAGAGGVLPPDATHNCRTRRSPLHATSPLSLPGLSRRRRWGAGGVKPGGCGGEVVRR